MHIVHCDITYILLETLNWCWLHAYLTDTKTWVSTVYFIIVVGSVPTNQMYFLILLLIFQEFSALDCVHRGINFQSCNCFSNWYSFRSGRQLNVFLEGFRALCSDSFDRIESQCSVTEMGGRWSRRLGHLGGFWSVSLILIASICTGLYQHWLNTAPW